MHKGTRTEALDALITITPSEVFDGLAYGILKEDFGKDDNCSAADLAEAYERARLVYPDAWAAANPSAAREQRRRLERRVEVERDPIMTRDAKPPAGTSGKPIGPITDIRPH